MAKTEKKIAKKGDRAEAVLVCFYRGHRYRVGETIVLTEGDKIGKAMRLLAAGEKPAEKEKPKPETPVALSQLAKKPNSNPLFS